MRLTAEEYINDLFLRELSRKWVLRAFPPTAPSPERTQIICDDDCDNCPLYQTGKCAKKCNRWENAICNDCPCLGSRNADWRIRPQTVDPLNPTDEEVPILPILLKIRRARKELEDGEKVDVRDIE